MASGARTRRKVNPPKAKVPKMLQSSERGTKAMLAYQFCLHISRSTHLMSDTVEDLTTEAVAEARKLGRATFIVDRDAGRVCRRISGDGTVKDVDEPIPGGW